MNANIKIGILSGIVVVLFLALFFDRSCNNKKIDAPVKESPSEIITIHDTIPGDSIPYKIYLPAPDPIIIIRDAVPEKVDTAAIIREYFTTNIYADTLKNDTSALIALVDTVRGNRLQGRNLIFQNRRPTAINTTFSIQKPRAGYYVGLSIGRDYKDYTLGLSLLFTPRKQRYAISYTYDIFNQDHYFTLYLSLRGRVR